ncbi:hypothetical protein BFP97_00590 [Roseivirga sp. 4D4]|uniref:ABC transporter permease n=1 Tax=Roseivirga sp. 4D4 TaxID=1889784 RepID=UPI000853C3C2|nr:ABC transporter permease [Roseivirga sp. 4D4]OEK00101.1 hypothetical protein BFP97_00590 [Roseivirga sp. 4D4]
MLKNYLKIAFRNLIKRKVTSLVNLLGLSIGITLTVLLILYAQYELDFDKFHKAPEQTYRLLRMEDLGNNTQIVAKTSPRIMLSLTEEFSEIESTTLLFKHWNVPLLSEEDKGFYEQDFLFADSSFFDVFGYELILGDPETALSEPNSLVITEQMAKKYFGDEDPMGRVLRYELKYDLEVTGVVKDPGNVGSHFEFDFLASMPTLPRVMTLDVLTGGYNGFYSYIHFRPDTDIQSFKTRYAEWLMDRFPEERIRIQPLLDIHLRSDAISEIEGQSDIMFVRVVLIIAIVVIILATINYINSAVSTSVERLKEMGVRMVSGAFAQHIYFQFILEAFLTIAIAIVVSLIALYFMITPFNAMLDTNLILNPIAQWQIWSVIAGLIMLTAVISGMAPAIVILRMDLTDVLLNVVTLGRIGYLRKGLMVFQFVVSVVLIVGAVTINRQAAFVKSKDLGFDQSQVIVVPIRDRGIHTGYESFKDNVLGIAGVTAVSRASTIPGRPYAAKYYKPEPAALDSILMNVGSIDDHYFQSLDIRLLTGTDFEFLRDELTNPVVVNETVIEAFELGDPLEALGKPMYHNGQKFMIVGVIQDFNYETLHKRIQPLVIQPGVALEDFMIIKYQGVNGDAVARQLSDLWYLTAYEQPFTYSSLSDDLASLYQSEKVWGDIGNLSMLVSVLIGALGVFGLVSLVVQKRFKEMGLRKIFGASHGNIIGIIYSEFFAILFVTLLIAVPSAYLLAQLWLQDFAYRIDVPIDGFVIAMALLASVTCLAVLFHTLRALAKDPINALSD